MRRRLTLRYFLFILLFALVIVGVISHAYLWLALCAVMAVAIGIFAERIENRPTEAYKHLNAQHHRKHPTSPSDDEIDQKV